MAGVGCGLPFYRTQENMGGADRMRDNSCSKLSFCAKQGCTARGRCAESHTEWSHIYAFSRYENARPGRYWPGHDPSRKETMNEP